jgi:hypothetical protein
MTYHPSSAVGVAIVLTASVVAVIGYRAVRSHIAWRNTHPSRRPARTSDRRVWPPTLQLAGGIVLIFGTLFAVVWDMGR